MSEFPSPPWIGPLSARKPSRGCIWGILYWNNLQLGMKHGRIASRFSHEISPCGRNQLLAPTDVPDVQLFARSAAKPVPDAAVVRRVSLDVATGNC